MARMGETPSSLPKTKEHQKHVMCTNTKALLSPGLPVESSNMIICDANFPPFFLSAFYLNLRPHIYLQMTPSYFTKRSQPVAMKSTV